MPDSFPNCGTLLFQSMLNPSSSQADKIYRLFNEFNIAATFIFLLVCILTVYICIKFRTKKGSKRAADTFTGNNKLEAVMIGIPALLVAFFFYKSFRTMHSIERINIPLRQADVIITGHQFWWEVSYPLHDVISANEVHLPINKDLLIEMKSADVIHDWWIPELGNKMDLIPGRTNHLWLHINKEATYPGLCSEFCGAQHAWMRLDVIAQSDTDYNKWLSNNSSASLKPLDSTAIKGAMVFEEATCATCHRIKGTSAQGQIGPDLTHLASRQKILGGMLTTNRTNLYQWINDPQKVKPGSKMPNFIYSKEHLDELVNYMTQLK